MNFSTSFLSAIWGASGLSGLDFLGSSQAPLQHVVTPASEGSFLNKVPPGFENVSVSFVRDHLAVIPGEWEAGGISNFICLKELSNFN